VRKAKVGNVTLHILRAMIRDRSLLTTEEAMDVIRDEYEFDEDAAREREMRGYLGRVVRAMRDAEGVRTTFLHPDLKEIINIDLCTDEMRVSAVVDMLLSQYAGLEKTLRKARARRAMIAGQTSLFDEQR